MSDIAKNILYLNIYALVLIVIVLITKNTADYVIWIIFSITITACVIAGGYLLWNSYMGENLRRKVGDFVGDFVDDYKIRRNNENAKPSPNIEKRKHKSFSDIVNTARESFDNRQPYLITPELPNIEKREHKSFSNIVNTARESFDNRQPYLITPNLPDDNINPDDNVLSN
jgi:hypothetical protein